MLGKQQLTTGNAFSISKEMQARILNIFNECRRYVWCCWLVICWAESFLSKICTLRIKISNELFKTTYIHYTNSSIKPSRTFPSPAQYAVQSKKGLSLKSHAIKHERPPASHIHTCLYLIPKHSLKWRSVKENSWFNIFSSELIWLSVYQQWKFTELSFISSIIFPL